MKNFCPIKDDVLRVNDQIRDADSLIPASPVYVEDVNGIMKKWIDRMAFNSVRTALYGKSAVVITTSGAHSSTRSINTMKKA